MGGGKTSYFYTRGTYETDVLSGVSPGNYFIKTDLNLAVFLSLKVVNMIAALSVFLVNETEFRPSGCASFVGWLPPTNADVPLGDQGRTRL